MTPAVLLTLAAAPYVLAVGVNDPGAKDVAPLQYADDDAAAFAALFGADWDRTHLLTVMDADTRDLYGGFASKAKPPTRTELARAAKEIATAIERGSDDNAIVLVSIGGHAAAGEGGHVELLLADGPLSRKAIIDEVIAPLAIAHRVHVFVDTCYAASLVRARARIEEEDGTAVTRRFLDTSLSRFGNVGAILGSAPGRQGFEWNEISSGVFSAIVRSALRGGADVDGDSAVSYAELEAFVSAASRGIPVARARPDIVAVPPAVEPNASIVRLAWVSGTVTAAGDLGAWGRFFVWTGAGRFVLGGRFEPGFDVRLTLPNEELFLARNNETAPLVATATGTLEVGAPLPADAAPRGVLGRALERGLFGVAYGPAFHRGFEASDARRALVVTTEREAPSTARVAVFSAAGVALLTAMIVGGVAIEAAVRAGGTDIERDAHDAVQRYRVFGVTSLATLSLGAGLTILATTME